MLIGYCDNDMVGNIIICQSTRNILIFLGKSIDSLVIKAEDGSPSGLFSVDVRNTLHQKCPRPKQRSVLSKFSKIEFMS
jgi:hypothetical protein